jgi:beta-glucanase (GH16 family)
MRQFAFVSAGLFFGGCLAQTFTSCDPLNSTCPADPALGTTYNVTFDASMTQLDANLWNVTAGSQLIQFSANGTEFSISESGQSVTVETTFYIFWGTVEVMMQAASGQGIISTFDMLSNDLDEIDLEIMGGNHSFVETNWYGEGNQSQRNSIYYPVDGPQDRMHNYTFDWNQDQLQWIIDGNVVRTLPYASPGLYPQTPSRMRIGIWAGGDASEPEGVIEWAGGLVNWNQGPFTMTVQSIKITDGSTNTSTYSYTDHTGSWKSIKAVLGESAAYKDLHQQSMMESVENRWDGLSTAGKIGIACGVIGALLLCVVAFFTFVCIQRRKGRKMALLENKEWDEQQNELLEYRQRMAKGGFAVTQMGHGQRH